MMEQLKSDNAINEEKPPILGSWKKIYFAVLLNVIVLIILFIFFPKRLNETTRLDCACNNSPLHRPLWILERTGKSKHQGLSVSR